MQLERGVRLWTETASSVPFEAWPGKIPESGGICIYEGRLKDLAQEVKKKIPIAAVIGSLPRPNQAFWTLSALWAGWLWGREAVEPYKLALRRRRYDWAWNATALNAAFTYLFELLPFGTLFFGLLSEPEPSFLTSALTAASTAGFDLQSLIYRINGRFREKQGAPVFPTKIARAAGTGASVPVECCQICGNEKLEDPLFRWATCRR